MNTLTPKRIWTEKELAFLRLHYQMRGAAFCAEALNRTRVSIRNRALREGLCPPKKRWGVEEVEVLRKEHGHLTEEKLCELFPDRSPKSVCQKARALGLQGPLYSPPPLDLSWTPDLAYFCGFFAADGCLFHRKGHGYRVVMGLQARDGYILEKFKNLYGGNLVPYQCEGQSYLRWRFYSIQLYEFLTSIGITPRKTYTLQWPSIPEFLLLHFVRGFFDGDGCIYRMKRGARSSNQVVKFTSASHTFLETLRKVLKEKAGVLGGGLHSRDNYHVLSYGKKDTKTLGLWMYQEGELFLTRKKEKFDESRG